MGLVAFFADATAKESAGWPGEIGSARHAAIPEGALPGDGRFVRMWQTISPDGAYVLGWGRPGARSSKFGEIPWDAGDSLSTDPSDEAMENYLVDAVHGTVLGKLPDLHYFAGKQRHHLICAWSPDSRAAVAVFQARWGNAFESRGIAYIDAAQRKSYPIVKQMNAIMARQWPDEVRRGGGDIPFFEPVMLDAHTFIVDAYGWEVEAPAYFVRRLVFRVAIQDGAARVALVKTSAIPEDEDLDPTEMGMSDEGKEEALLNAYRNLRAKLGREERRILQQSQARWLRYRAAHEGEDTFTYRRIRELVLRAKWRSSSFSADALPGPGTQRAASPARFG